MNTKKMHASISALTDISKYSLDFYQKFSMTAPASVGFETRGLLLVSATDDGIKYALHEQQMMHQRGIEGKWLSKDEVLAFEPALKSLIKGGIYFPQEAQVEPLAMTQAIAEDFIRLGGRLLIQHEAFDFEVKGDRITKVITTQGAFEADHVILAAGTWSTALGKSLGVNIPILGGKGYSMNFKANGKKPQRPIMIVEKKIAVTPRAHSVRVAGTLELVNQDLAISPRRLQAIQNGARQYLHLDEGDEPTEIWRGLRPCTPDGVPLIGPSKKLSYLFYCMGHQLLGLQSAPGSAKLAADLFLQTTPLTDPYPFRAERFE